jgi:hypothetical protein
MRPTLAWCALSALSLSFVACAGGAPAATSSPGSMASVADAGARDATADALAPNVAALGASCPEDAPWTGTVCLGRGYVACPSGMYMDAKNKCTGALPLPLPRAVDASAEAGEDER